jgi:nicotinate-nucleotide adenylyltransferase
MLHVRPGRVQAISGGGGDYQDYNGANTRSASQIPCDRGHSATLGVDSRRGPASRLDCRPLRRLGIFGGTFDPPHVGHLVAAVNVRHTLALDVVLLVVANDPWQKSGERTITEARDRLAMVEAAVGDVEGLEASDIELRRGGTSYTADTMAELHAKEPGTELFLVLGSDAAAGLTTWERADEVRTAATVVVVTRPGAEAGEPPSGWSWITVESPRLEVSSTDLRRRFVDGRPLDYLITPAVIDCIEARGLYR